MNKLGKIIGKLTLGALAASVLPYRFQMDRDTGAFEVGSLLWAVKKTPGTERDTYTVELLPLFGGKDEPAEEAPVEVPAAEEAPAEPAAEEAPAEPAAEPEA